MSSPGISGNSIDLGDRTILKIEVIYVIHLRCKLSRICQFEIFQTEIIVDVIMVSDLYTGVRSFNGSTELFE